MDYLVCEYGNDIGRLAFYGGLGNGDYQQKIIEAIPGSIALDVHDFNGDGYMDILYVNGDNFDHSQILKPYHGIRIFENDGENRFERKYFYPVYGAAKAQAHDFDLDGDLDLIVAANFADLKNNPERGIMYFECTCGSL
jgi:hypothetical protein